MSYQTREGDLQSFFEKYGNVTRVKILTRDDGKSKGIGFVTFESNSDAKNAMDNQDNLELDSRYLNWFFKLLETFKLVTLTKKKMIIEIVEEVSKEIEEDHQVETQLPYLLETWALALMKIL